MKKLKEYKQEVLSHSFIGNNGSILRYQEMPAPNGVFQKGIIRSQLNRIRKFVIIQHGTFVKVPISLRKV